MTLRKVEIAVWCIIITVSIHALGWGAHFAALHPKEFLWLDTMVYRSAGMTDGFVQGWFYLEPTRLLFAPLGWFNPVTAYLLFGSVNVISYLFLTHKLSEVKYGIFASVAFLPIYHSVLQSGNVEILLAFVCCYSLGAVGSIFFKPFLFGLALISPEGRNAIKNLARLYDKKQA